MSGDYTIEDFKSVFSSPAFDLPIRWDGNSFLEKLKDLFDMYHQEMCSLWRSNDSLMNLSEIVSHVCDEIIKSIENMLNGKPSEAFARFNELFLNFLMPNQFSLYNTLYDPSILEKKTKAGRSKLYRVRKVAENKTYGRKDIFHTPYYFRSKVATTRYSIAGYPSLYLSTSLELCLEEMEYEINPGRYICSRFEMSNESTARIIELGIKPKDFFLGDKTSNSKRCDLIDQNLLANPQMLGNYYIWFPLIAACSFMRTNRTDPFAIEYVVPQLLMQSIRSFKTDGVFMGIRYFSCSSKYSSELGFNYVFPTNYDGNSAVFCPVLSKSFLLTKPLFLNEYKKIPDCELALRNSKTGNVESDGEE